jgi:hypothetical protein
VIPAIGAIFVQASSAGTINIPTTTIFKGTPAQAGIYNHKTAQSVASCLCFYFGIVGINLLQSN